MQQQLRQAAIEAAFFFQETKQAVNRLAEKTPKNLSSNPPPLEQQAQADVLPEVLKHSLPSKVFRQPSDPSSLSRASKWALHSNPNNGSGSSPDALNPLRAYLSFPQVTFGPKRWELSSTENSISASTANELQKDKYTPLNPEKLKAAAEGLKRIATTVIFGGSALMFGIAASKLELHTVSITY
ncbi:chitin elicitor receptor kinase 1-like isoform X1 [Hibiscus syriacus]|uniref:Chitin elicitor receptor kinase 1-like isoform X1 n=1 Tax=Hibiscus syriacus TaxID=106335 RepID=A0A6A2ZTK8_HIBSY|nr:chitin elicitor receptor kinase 1-like isoform X1 [Hibiscus syriacus]